METHAHGPFFFTYPVDTGVRVTGKNSTIDTRLSSHEDCIANASRSYETVSLESGRKENFKEELLVQPLAASGAMELGGREGGAPTQ